MGRAATQGDPPANGMTSGRAATANSERMAEVLSPAALVAYRETQGSSRVPCSVVTPNLYDSLPCNHTCLCKRFVANVTLLNN